MQLRQQVDHKLLRRITDMSMLLQVLLVCVVNIQLPGLTVWKSRAKVTMRQQQSPDGRLESVRVANQ